jgi:hypothetical protein
MTTSNAWWSEIDRETHWRGLAVLEFEKKKKKKGETLIFFFRVLKGTGNLL